MSQPTKDSSSQNQNQSQSSRTQTPQSNSEKSLTQAQPKQQSASEVLKELQDLNIQDKDNNEKEEQPKNSNQEENTSVKSQDQDKAKKSSQNQNTQQQLFQTKYFVQINRNEVMFGKQTMFPGSIQQVDLSIGLKDDMLDQQAGTNNNPLMLRVTAKCNNPEFNDLDQYVFSVRSNERFEYFQQVRFKIRRKQRAQIKVAVKIPPVLEDYNISGVLEVQLEELAPVFLPITAKCQVPKIICIRDLYKPDQDTQLIKIPAKKNQPRMPPIPFKNLSNFNFTLEVQAISNKSFSDQPFDVVTQNFVNCQANTQFFVNMQLKLNLNYTGKIPSRQTIRKILVLKIKNSTVFYHYPIEVYIFESSVANTMS